MPRPRCLAAIAFLILLSGCKTNLTLDVYSSDLSKVGKDSLTTPGMLAIEIPSSKECEKYSKQIGEMMKDLVKNFEPRGCKDVEMESFLNAAIEVPIVAGFEAWKSERTLFGVVLQEYPSMKGWTAVAVAMNLEAYKALNKRMDREFHQTLKIEKSKVTVIFHNDGRAEQRFGAGFVFVDGLPVASAEIPLKRRSKATIELSNVHSALLSTKGKALAFALPNS